MKKFLVFASAIFSGLFVFGVGIYRGLYYPDSSRTGMTSILVHAAVTSILISLGGVVFAWSLRWIQKQKKAAQDREISN
jgi:hypothetical protein